MNDRERIARTIRETEARIKGFTTPYDELQDHAILMFEACADAVLAALADRLLPELPEGTDLLEVRIRSSSECRARVVGDVIDTRYWNRGNMTRRVLEGTGPTIPAAIAAALQDAPDAP